jgi:hypothetical protein
MFTKVNAKALLSSTVVEQAAGLSLGFHPPPVKATRYTQRIVLNRFTSTLTTPDPPQQNLYPCEESSRLLRAHQQPRMKNSKRGIKKSPMASGRWEKLRSVVVLSCGSEQLLSPISDRSSAPAFRDSERPAR